jgi:hypothetical protein
MKKINLTLIAIVMAVNFLYAQNINYTTQTFTYDGNTVYHYGLGWYTDPDALAYGPMAYLSAFGGIKFFTGGAFKAVLDVNGNLGIGTNSPLYRLDASGAIHSSVTSGSNFIMSKATGASLAFDNGSGIQTGLIEAGTSDNHLEFWTNTASNSGLIERMRVTNAGNLLIGQTTQVNPAYKLDVAGYVRASEIVVNTTGADFVFDPSYKMSSLSSLEKYIRYNHHLPEIAPAKQMQAEGLNVGENETKLLQKVEELTLFLIEKDKQLKEQEERIKRIEIELQTIAKHSK